MKRLLMLMTLVSLIACQKKEPDPAPTPLTTTPASTITTTPSKTISITCSTTCSGTLNVCWDYKWNTFIDDSTYYYTHNTFTKETYGDSIFIQFVSTIPTVSACPSDVTVTVNGVTKATYINDQTSLFYFIKI